MKVSVDEFARAVEGVLEDYQETVTTDVKREVGAAAEFCRSEIQQEAPGRGKYAASWSADKAYEDAYDVRYRVRSKKYYMLTHLLEYGHDKWLWGHPTGGRVEAKPHIRKAEEKAEEQLITKIKMVIR